LHESEERNAPQDPPTQSRGGTPISPGCGQPRPSIRLRSSRLRRQGTRSCLVAACAITGAKHTRRSPRGYRRRPRRHVVARCGPGDDSERPHALFSRRRPFIAADVQSRYMPPRSFRSAYGTLMNASKLADRTPRKALLEEDWSDGEVQRAVPTLAFALIRPGVRRRCSRNRSREPVIS